MSNKSNFKRNFSSFEKHNVNGSGNTITQGHSNRAILKSF